MTTLLKTFETTIKRQGDKQYWIASTADVDRQGDVMSPQKFVLDNWRRNGSLLLWGHNYADATHVIGAAVDVQLTATEFKILPRWREPASPTDTMHVIRSLIDQGLARAMSIGFRALEAPTRNQHGGLTYHSVEILEVSVVPVPANPLATLAMRRGAYGYRRPDPCVVALGAYPIAMKAIDGLPGARPHQLRLLKMYLDALRAVLL
jgi:HK97 family phage prohead protease